jgi:hypothetical protein
MISDSNLPSSNKDCNLLAVLLLSLPICLATSEALLLPYSLRASLNKLLDELTQSLQIDNSIESKAAEFLSRGPTLHKATTRLTATERTITIESEM